MDWTVFRGSKYTDHDGRAWLVESITPGDGPDSFTVHLVERIPWSEAIPDGPARKSIRYTGVRLLSGPQGDARGLTIGAGSGSWEQVFTDSARSSTDS